MARPKKDNAEYFSHDADMRNDVKVKALRRKFAHKGYAVWCFLLETLTNEEFFEIKYNEIGKELLAADFDIQTEELDEIVDYCCKINLLQLNDDTLCSLTLKKRFKGLIEERGKKSLAGKLGMAKRWEKFNTVTEQDNRVIENDNNVITVLPKSITQDNRVIENDNNVITVLPKSITENNKVKYSKVKESKVKERKVKKIYPYDEIVALWNEKCSSLPKVSKLSDGRKTKIKCRLEEFGEEYSWIPIIESIFEAINSSNFLRGNNDSNWQASFDWVFANDKNWVKILEGNYANKKTARQANSSTNLGVGEYIEQGTGRRTYGTGKATIPVSAPPRPTDKHAWSSGQNNWILL